jgi:hypothetical protein
MIKQERSRRARQHALLDPRLRAEVEAVHYEELPYLNDIAKIQQYERAEFPEYAEFIKKSKKVHHKMYPSANKIKKITNYLPALPQGLGNTYLASLVPNRQAELPGPEFRLLGCVVLFSVTLMISFFNQLPKDLLNLSTKPCVCGEYALLK